MHICMVTETYPPEINGVAMTLSRLVEGLMALGHQMSLVRPRQQTYDRPGCCAMPHTTLVRGIPVPGYRGIHLGMPAGKALRKAWQSNPPDVVYVATEGPLGWSVLREAERQNIPVVSGFHTNFHSYARHYGAGILQKLILKILSNFHNRSSGTLVPNQVLAGTLRGAGFQNVNILARGVNCDQFNPAHRSQSVRAGWGVRPGDPVMLYVGRLAAEKNLSLAIRCYRQGKEQNDRLKFVVVGDGPLYDSLQHDNPDVIFCGMHTGTTLARYYASADIFVFPSETETFGNVVLEALASGLAVIAYDYAAAQAHIQHAVSGMLAAPGNTHEFIQNAGATLQQTEQTCAMRKQARQHAETIHWEKVIREFEYYLHEAWHAQNNPSKQQI